MRVWLHMRSRNCFTGASQVAPVLYVCCLVLDLSKGFILAPHTLVLTVAAASTGLTQNPYTLVLQMLLPPQALHSVLAQVLAASCRAS